MDDAGRVCGRQAGGNLQQPRMGLLEGEWATAFKVRGQGLAGEKLHGQASGRWRRMNRDIEDSTHIAMGDFAREGDAATLVPDADSVAGQVARATLCCLQTSTVCAAECPLAQASQLDSGRPGASGTATGTVTDCVRSPNL